MTNAHCPICGGATELYISGTTNPADFFEKTSGYQVAAGGKQKLPLRKCQDCGHGYTPLQIPEASILDWYARMGRDEAFLAGEAGRRKTSQVVLDRLGKIQHQGRLIDVGSGPGFFLDEARARGWDVSGVEVASWAVAYAKQVLHLPVIQGDFHALAKLPAESVEAVCSFDVIEHVVDPKQFLQAIHHLLIPAGTVVITTPWFGSPLAQAMGRHWYCIFPAHIHYFTRTSITRLLHDAGFEVLRIRRHTRYLSWRYVWQRFWEYLGAKGTIQNITGSSMPINFGDEFEIYARKV